MAELRGRFRHLVDELKRRGVLRAAAVYLVAAWLAIQVSDVTFPRLGVPDWAVTFVILLLAALFPVVIGVSWVFDLTRTGPRRVPEPAHDQRAAAGDVATASAAPSRARVPARVPILLAGLLALPLVGFGLWWTNDARAANLDEQLVAVTPFRVAGASPEVAYLREGLMDLIAARIGAGAGEGALRVVAPRTMSRRLRETLGSVDAEPESDEALELALALGAGRLLEGEVVGSESAVTVTAKLYDVRSGRATTHRMGPVPADSLHALVDEIVTRLIAAESGLRADRLAAITTRSLPALRAFIEAEHAFRRGQHARAIRAYDQAVQLDTTFALAALGLLRARGWSVSIEAETSFQKALRIVARGADRLGEADRAFYELWRRDDGEGQADRIEEARRAAERHPELADVRYLAGDRLLHFGEWVGVEDALERARRQLEQVVDIDSAYGEPIIHLFELAIGRADTAGMRRYGRLLLAIDSTTTYATKVRYVRALGLDGSQGAPPVRLDTLPVGHLDALTHVGWGAPILDEVWAEYLRRWRGATLPEEIEQLSMRVELTAMRGGLPSLIEEVDRRLGHQEWTDVTKVLRAIYWLRDADAARASVDDLRNAAGQAPRSSDPAAQFARLGASCMSAHLAVVTSDAAGARRAAQALSDTVGFAPWMRDEATACAMYATAGAAVASRESGARRLVTLLDDYLRAGPDVDEYIGMTYLLGVAWLYEELGDRESALRVVRRRIYVPFSQFWLNELTGEEARLADALGRRDEAIAAYRAYLAHLRDPEPPFDERAQRARERLAVLVGEARR